MGKAKRGDERFSRSIYTQRSSRQYIHSFTSAYIFTLLDLLSLYFLLLVLSSDTPGQPTCYTSFPSHSFETKHSYSPTSTLAHSCTICPLDAVSQLPSNNYHPNPNTSYNVNTNHLHHSSHHHSSIHLIYPTSFSSRSNSESQEHRRRRN